MVIRNLAIDPLKFDAPVTVVSPEYRPALQFGLSSLYAVGRTLATTLGRICSSRNCHYCGAPFRRTDSSTYDGETIGGRWYDVCDDCGFWRWQEGDSALPSRCTIPLAKDFNPDLSTAALDELAASIFMDPDRVSALDPARFERLVGSILRNHFNCEVFHTGRTGDGGVDLLAVRGERTLLVQVKRRTKRDAREGLEAVKLMIASTLLRGETEAMLVTSAQRFTAGAKRTAEAFGRIDRRYKMSLVTLSQLLDMVDAASCGERLAPYQLDKARRRSPEIGVCSVETVESDRGLLVRAVSPDRVEHFALDSGSPDTITRWNVDFELDLSKEGFARSYDRSERSGTGKCLISMTSGYERYGVPLEVVWLLEQYAARLPRSGVALETP